MKFLISVFSVIVISLGLSGCTDAKNAERILTSQGYTDVQITGYDFFGCSEDDFQHTGFKAKSVNGSDISGTVCSGILFKNSTVRIR